MQFRSSVFELYLHELLMRLGYSIEVHRDSGSGKTGRPDFYAEAGRKYGTYLEAVLSTGMSDSERGAMMRENTVYDAINGIRSPDFSLLLAVRGSPETTPPQRRLRVFLEEWLGRLDYLRLCEIYKRRGPAGMPRHTFSHQGWHIEFTPIPKAPDKRGRPGVRPIGVTLTGVQLNNAKEAMHDSVKEKASRYGDLRAPFVVAVNSLVLGVDREDAVDALFGSQQMIVPLESGEDPEIEWTRARDGIWVGKDRPQHTSMSAVLFVKGLTAWSLATPTPILYFNPWARYPLSGPIETLSVCRPYQGKLKFSDGIHPRTLFDLPSNWPETER
jgi:hypothetical protein